MESILQSIKKLLGIEYDYDAFDTDIIIHINSVLLVLAQIGVGPSEGFSISGASETWKDFLGDSKLLNAVRTYVYLRVRLLFDPPTSSGVTEAINKTVSELEWRLNVVVDKGGENK